MARLESKKINYMTIDPRNNYDIDYKIDYKNLNEYNDIVEKAQKYIRLKRRIERLSNALIQDIGKDEVLNKIKIIEEIVYENREI